MAGENPYIRKVDAQRPEQPFTITFSDLGTSITVDPSKIPYCRTGLPGSILEIALGNGVEIDHACGGVSACSTCHVLVKSGLDTCNEADDDELDQLDEAPGTTAQSRLACRCIPNGTRDLIVEIPAWNVNRVREAPH